MKVAIHQPHYFPWLGYFDKMAKVNKFILMDEVQLENRSYMCRNRFINKNGDLLYLSVTASKTGYREKKYREIETIDCDKWQHKHRLFFSEQYKYSPYFSEVYERLEPVLTKKYQYLNDVTYDSIESIKKMLDIPTSIIFQSKLNCNDYNLTVSETIEQRRSNDVLAICIAAKATSYLTGAGASLGFLDQAAFKSKGIQVAVQNYSCPNYKQRYSMEFIPNLSALDLLFNCGIEHSREIFWENVGRGQEFDD